VIKIGVFDKINNDTTVNAFKQVSQTRDRKVFVAGILQVWTFHKYTLHCE